MKIAVKKITERGTGLEEKIPAESWNLDGFDTKFVGPIKIQGQFKKIYNEVISSFKIATHRQINCSRCLAEVCQVKTYSFQKSYQLNKLGIFLDINQDIREEILLNFSLKVLCSSNCRGLCLKCGRNLNWGKCHCFN